MFKTRGELFIISAPSGAGKTTLCNMLRKRFGSIAYSVSHTTRPPRAQEVDGVHYYFVSQNRFEEMVNHAEFLEHAKVHGNMYGTSKAYVDEQLRCGKDILLEIDPQGAMQLKKLIDYGVFIFILPPSKKVLRERLKLRNDTGDSLELRLINAVSEVSAVPSYDYAVINDDLNEAFSKIEAIYIAEKCRTTHTIDYKKYIEEN